MNDKTKKGLVFLGLLIFGALIFGTLYQQISIQEVTKTLKNVNLELILWFLITSVAIMVSLALRWDIVLRAQGYKVPFWNLFSYRIIGFGVSYITPSARIGGEPVRAALLGKHKIPFRDALASAITDKSIELTFSGIFFILGALILLANLALPEDLKYTVYVAGGIITSLVIYFYYRMLNGNPFLLSFFRTIKLNKIKKLRKTEKELEKMEAQMINFYQNHKRSFLIAGLYSLLSWIFMFAEYEILIAMTGNSFTFYEIFLVVSVVGASTLVPVPMALGVMEAGQVGLFSAMNIIAGAALALSIMVRSRDILWTIIGFIFAAIYHFSPFKKRK